MGSAATTFQRVVSVGDIFATRVENARTAQISRFFRGVYCGELSPKFQMYNEEKANGVLTRENQNTNNKSAEKA